MNFARGSAIISFSGNLKRTPELASQPELWSDLGDLFKAGDRHAAPHSGTFAAREGRQLGARLFQTSLKRLINLRKLITAGLGKIEWQLCNMVQETESEARFMAKIH